MAEQATAGNKRKLLGSRSLRRQQGEDDMANWPFIKRETVEERSGAAAQFL